MTFHRNALAVALGAALALAACNQGASSNRKVDNSEARKEQILANLFERHSRLKQLNPELGDFEKVGPQFDSITMKLRSPRGTQEQTLLVSENNEKLYIVMDGPIDASKSATELETARAQEQKERAKELGAAIKGEPIRGAAKAPVTVIEFSDFQCPYCKRGFDTMEQVMKQYSEQVQFVFMHYPLPFHPWAKPAAIAAECAAMQKPEAFWTLHDAYFEHQRDLKTENVVEKSAEYLAGAGIDMDSWKTCASDEESEAHKKAAKEVDDEMALGKKHGVTGTPAFFIDGEFVSGAVPFAEIERRIKESLGTSEAPAGDEKPAAKQEAAGEKKEG